MKFFGMLALALSLGAAAEFAGSVASPSPSGAGVQLDSKLPIYQEQSGEVAGDIKSIGSDTMVNLMLLWSEGFKRFYPDVKAEIDGKGSATAPPALINGAANFGPMSRDWKASEIDDFENHFGYKPTSLATSIDMLAVYVNKDCPLEKLTLEQLDALFSVTRKGGYEKDITHWGDLGLKGDWADKPISLYGRNSASGTYQYFKEHALFGGDFKSTVAQQPSSSSVVDSVAGDKYGIGYSGIGYKTPDVKAISLDAGAGSVKPLPENAYDDKYPLSRELWLSVNYRSGSTLDPLRREFIRYVLSQQGQREVIKDGYLPLTAAMVEKQLAKVGLTMKFTAEHEAATQSRSSN
jgi:phosphate transport system substrate-binding protein